MPADAQQRLLLELRQPLEDAGALRLRKGGRSGRAGWGRRRSHGGQGGGGGGAEELLCAQCRNAMSPPCGRGSLPPFRGSVSRIWAFAAPRRHRLARCWPAPPPPPPPPASPPPPARAPSGRREGEGRRSRSRAVSRRRAAAAGSLRGLAASSGCAGLSQQSRRVPRKCLGSVSEVSRKCLSEAVRTSASAAAFASAARRCRSASYAAAFGFGARGACSHPDAVKRRSRAPPMTDSASRRRRGGGVAVRSACGGGAARAAESGVVDRAGRCVTKRGEGGLWRRRWGGR